MLATHGMLLATQSGMLQHSTAEADAVPDAVHGRARAPNTAFAFGRDIVISLEPGYADVAISCCTLHAAMETWGLARRSVTTS